MSQTQTTTSLYHKKLSLLDSFSLVGHSKTNRKMLSIAYLDGDTSSSQEKQENHSLCQHLRSFKVLFQFNLAINSFSSLDIHNLSHNITHLRSTTSLNLKLGYNNIIQTPTILLLYSSLKYLKALQTLQLKFSSCSSLLTAHIRQFCKSLQKCCSLHDLSLDFSYCDFITEDFLTILFKSLSSLYKLSALTLIFYSCLELTSSHLQLFRKSLSRLSRLQHLRIDLDMGPPIGTEGYQVLSLAIGSLTNLKILDLSFFGCSDFVDGPCEDLCENISKLKSLEVLGLCLKACPLTDKGLEALASCLLELPELRKLKLIATDLTKSTREGYEKLIKSIGRTKNLEYLELNLGHIREIDDGALEVIGKNLKGLGKLRTLALELARCEELSDEGVERLIECFEGLEGLYDLSLDLRNCGKVTKKGVKSVYEKLKDKYGMVIGGVSYSYKWIVMKNRMPEDE